MPEGKEWLQLDDFQVPRHEIAESKIKNYRNDEEFNFDGIELLNEFGKIFNIASHSFFTSDKANLRLKGTNAVIRGLMIRSVKLIIAWKDAFCERRVEIVMILSRCLYETLVNVAYFL